MFGNDRFDRVRETFKDQFSTDSNGTIYRKNQKGAPIRISEIERDGFVAAFNKRIRYATWALIPAIIILGMLLVWLAPDTGPPTSVAIWVGFGAILIPYMAFFFWAWNAPARALQSRTPEGVALTKAEARALAFSKITYGQLAMAAAMGVGLVWNKSAKTDIFHGVGLLWLFGGASLVSLAGVQAIRKWLFDRQHS